MLLSENSRSKSTKNKIVKVVDQEVQEEKSLNALEITNSFANSTVAEPALTPAEEPENTEVEKDSDPEDSDLAEVKEDTTASSDGKIKKIKTSLKDLKNLSPKNLAILLEENVTTLEDVCEYSVVELKTLLKTTENKANLIIGEARKSLPPFKSLSGHDLLKTSLSQQYLSTNCKSIDVLLGGKGFKTGTVSEVYGAFASGKTQMVLSLILSAVMPKPYGLDGAVIFIDTEGTFNVERLMQIGSYYKKFITTETLLNNIKVIRPRKSVDQIQIIKRFLENGASAYKDYLKLEKNVKLLVIDSLTAHFRAEYLGRGTLAERQQKLSEHLRDIGDFAYENDCCGIVVNQVMANPDPFSVQDSELPIGGNILSHSTYCRIWLRKRKLYRSAVLVDSACLPAGEALYKIGPRGILDVNELETTEGDFYPLGEN